jgi:hypothetical protein
MFEKIHSLYEALINVIYQQKPVACIFLDDGSLVIKHKSNKHLFSQPSQSIYLNHQKIALFSDIKWVEISAASTEGCSDAWVVKLYISFLNQKHIFQTLDEIDASTTASKIGAVLNKNVKCV